LIGQLNAAIAAGTRIDSCAAQDQHGESLASTQQSSTVGQALYRDLPAIQDKGAGEQDLASGEVSTQRRDLACKSAEIQARLLGVVAEKAKGRDGFGCRQYHGHDAPDRICGELRASHPSYVYTPHNAPIVVQDGGRVDWGSGPAREPPRYTGIDIIITRDDKISALYVFLNSPPI
jgi:hypothetical protein